MVQVAPLGREVADRVADPVAEPQCGAELAGREPSHLGDVQQVAGRVGQ